MRHFVYALSLALVPALSVSCDDDCCCNPSASSGTIAVTVMDKNYNNLEETEGQQRRDEGLPISSYLSSVTVWRHAEGTDTSESFVSELRPEDMYVSIDPAFLQPGTNELMVVGNESMQPQKYDSSAITRELHPGAEEYADIYIGSDEIVSPVEGDRTIRMFRAKGKLLILTEGLPSDIAEVELRVGNVYRRVGRNLIYSDSTGIVKRFDLRQSASATELSLLAAPSRSPEGVSMATVKLVGQDGSTTVLSNICTGIHRNRISVIKPIYDSDSGEWTLEMLVDGRWTQLENLRID